MGRFFLAVLLCQPESVGLFISLTEALVSGGAAWLTRWRGARWKKELDHFYLVGVLGLMASLGKIENV
jgi:hypothetical protein